jgi:hypothetical protein
MQSHQADIESIAKEMLGCSEVSVDIYVEHRNWAAAGPWFGLAVRWQPGGEWEPLGRRRGYSELVELIRCVAAQRLTSWRN